MSDTPRTDANVKKHKLCQLSGNDLVYANFPRQLERELTAMTKQRDGIEAKLRMELRGHPDSELWGDAGLIAATMRCVDAVEEITEQRDEWKAKYIQQNKDLGCELMDPNGTIWDHANKLETELTAMTEQRDGLRSGIDYASDQLHKVTEQRDRMAVLLSDMQDYTKGVKRYDYSKLTLYKRMEVLHDDWQEIECRIEQLLQTTPTQNETK
jgi:hypothetical protein